MQHSEHSEPMACDDGQLEQAVQAFQNALQHAHQTPDTSQQQKLLCRARRQLVEQVQQLMGHTVGLRGMPSRHMKSDGHVQQGSAPAQETATGNSSSEQTPLAEGNDTGRQQDIAVVSKALQTALHNSLQRQHQRLSRMSQQLLQLETQMHQLTKRAGTSNAEGLQAQQEAHTSQQRSSAPWEEFTDGFGYVRKDVLRQRHRQASHS